ncbi:MAG: hypothetical protein DRO06_04790, partial [Thermoproteota archaeon]
AVRRGMEWALERAREARGLYDLSFALRLVALSTRLGTPDEGVVREVLSRFLEEVERAYDPSFDSYHSELAGIALLEFSSSLRNMPEGVRREAEERLMRMTPLPPRFILEDMLRRMESSSEVLYCLPIRGRLMTLVDALVSLDVLSLLIGTAMGLFLVVGGASERLALALASELGPTTGALAWALLLALAGSWLGLKALPPRGRVRSLAGFALSLLAAAWCSSALLGLPPDSRTLRAVLFLAVAIDVVGEFVDKAVLARVLRR